MPIPFSRLIIGTAVLLGACQTVPRASIPVMATASLVSPTGATVGTATITAPSNAMPTLTVSVAGLPAGAHGLHLHAVGKCDGPSFSSADGHLNPDGHQHGTLNPAGSHLGDVPNLMVGSDGTGALKQTLRVTAATLRGQLLDGDGTAIVVHAGADDYRTDPSGNSGARIACGIFLPG
jgi:Cu-Zn family superoxide dismutase